MALLNVDFYSYYLGMDSPPVSYTHLDVYKRQEGEYPALAGRLPRN